MDLIVNCLCLSLSLCMLKCFAMKCIASDRFTNMNVMRPLLSHEKWHSSILFECHTRQLIQNSWISSAPIAFKMLENIGYEDLHYTQLVCEQLSIAPKLRASKKKKFGRI